MWVWIPIPAGGVTGLRRCGVVGGDAERALGALVASVGSQRAIGARSRVSDLLEAWFAISVTSWAPTTIRQTRSVLDRYLHPHLGALPVGEVTPAIIDAAYGQLRRGGGVRGQPLAAGTLARVHVVLRSALAQAVRWGWIWDNPAERAHRIVATPAEIRPSSPTELGVLLERLQHEDPRMHLFVVLAAVTGARRAQLLGLRWWNVDLERGRVSFCAGWVEGPDGPVLADTKTKRRHVVDLDAATVEVISAHRVAVEVLSTGEEFVFSDDGA